LPYGFDDSAGDHQAVVSGRRRAVRLAAKCESRRGSCGSPSREQALTDLLTTLERDTDVEYGTGGSGLTQEEIDAARADVAKDMGSGELPLGAPGSGTMGGCSTS
jgi:hypothetical protein